MPYRSLTLQQFRSYSTASVELSPQVTIIVGPNGSGKTNLLEALYVLSQGTSFRVADKDLIQHEQPWFRLEAIYDEHIRILTYTTESLPAKQFKLDGLKKQRLTHSQRVGVVLFEPDELRLLSGSPARRRDYLDALLVRIWPEASRVKNQFDRALLQRNNMLKRGYGLNRKQLEDALFVWDMKVAEYAAGLVGYRQRVLDYCNAAIGELYGRMAGKNTAIALRYEPSISITSDYRSTLLHALQTRLERDLERGYTSAGPHREDFSVWMDGSDAGLAASRGEVRTLVLALKIIELRLMQEHTAHPPLLLLDDVFSELDTARRQALAELASEYQTVITTTDADVVGKYFTNNHKIKTISTSEIG